MSARITFLAIAVFWVTMNVLLWRAEFGSHADETPVPVQLVWRKILTAPDASSLSVYQSGERSGYCEVSTGVGQEMAALDTDKLPPEGLAKRAGYEIKLAGNLAFGDFTNRIKFSGNVQFRNAREWRHVYLKISTRTAIVEVESQATNQVVHFRLTTASDQMERVFTFAELQNPTTVVRGFLGHFADALVGVLDLPDFSNFNPQQGMEWTACRTRVKMGAEDVTVYRLESSLLGHPIIVDVSTLGEILQVRLPDDVVAQVDEWVKP